MPKRLPIIRHVRWLIWSWRVERHLCAMGRAVLPVNREHDDRVLDAIWRGQR